MTIDEFMKKYRDQQNQYGTGDIPEMGRRMVTDKLLSFIPEGKNEFLDAMIGGRGGRGLAPQAPSPASAPQTDTSYSLPQASQGKDLYSFSAGDTGSASSMPPQQAPPQQPAALSSGSAAAAPSGGAASGGGEAGQAATTGAGAVASMIKW
jgi:hypothetical protein